MTAQNEVSEVKEKEKAKIKSSTLKINREITEEVTRWSDVVKVIYI